jgi:antitoxin FitA
MASLLQIRNVPENDRRALKARAAARGESLNTYLLTLIARDVSRPTVAEVLERAARRVERVGPAALSAIDTARSERDEQLARRPAR